MRNFFITVLFFIPFLAFSQKSRKPITDFFGIPFGSNIEKVKAEMIGKGARFAADSSNNDMLTFTNVSWESRKNLYLLVQFIDDKAFEADLAFYNESPEKAMELYQNVVKETNEIYGNGDTRSHFFAPYAEYDGKELQGVAESKVFYTTDWLDFKNDNAIQARLMPEYFTGLRFYNSSLLTQATKKANGH